MLSSGHKHRYLFGTYVCVCVCVCACASRKSADRSVLPECPGNQRAGAPGAGLALPGVDSKTQQRPRHENPSLIQEADRGMLAQFREVSYLHLQSASGPNVGV